MKARSAHLTMRIAVGVAIMVDIRTQENYIAAGGPPVANIYMLRNFPLGANGLGFSVSQIMRRWFLPDDIGGDYLVLNEGARRCTEDPPSTYSPNITKKGVGRGGRRGVPSWLGSGEIQSGASRRFGPRRRIYRLRYEPGVPCLAVSILNVIYGA